MASLSQDVRDSVGERLLRVTLLELFRCAQPPLAYRPLQMLCQRLPRSGSRTQGPCSHWKHCLCCEVLDVLNLLDCICHRC